MLIGCFSSSASAPAGNGDGYGNGSAGLTLAVAAGEGFQRERRSCCLSEADGRLLDALERRGLTVD